MLGPEPTAPLWPDGPQGSSGVEQLYEALNPSAVTEPSVVKRTSIACPVPVLSGQLNPWQRLSSAAPASVPSYTVTKS